MDDAEEVLITSCRLLDDDGNELLGDNTNGDGMMQYANPEPRMFAILRFEKSALKFETSKNTRKF